MMIKHTARLDCIEPVAAPLAIYRKRSRSTAPLRSSVLNASHSDFTSLLSVVECKMHRVCFKPTTFNTPRKVVSANFYFEGTG